MSALEPGMLVECVDDAPGRFGKVLVKGHVYIIRDVYTPGAEWGDHGNPGVRLKGISFPLDFDGVEPGFRVDRFRPLGGDRLAIFRQHLVPVPSKTKETA